MLLLFAMLSLICALMSGVFGFGVDAQADWTWQKVSFFIFLPLAAGSFIRSALSKPSPVYEIVDEIQSKRLHNSRHNVTHNMKGDHHD